MTAKFVPPRVPLVDLRTGTITREWYLLFQSFFSSSGGGLDPDGMLYAPASQGDVVADTLLRLRDEIELTPPLGMPLAVQAGDDLTPSHVPALLAYDDLTPPPIPTIIPTFPLSVANGGTGDNGSPWTAYASTITATSGAFTTVSAASFYKTIGKTVFVQIDISITTNGTAAGLVRATLPFAAARRSCIAGVEFALTGFALTGTTNAGNLTIAKYDFTYPGADGARLVLTGVYEAA